MKKICLFLMIVGALFACSDDEEPRKSSLASIEDLKIEFKGIDAKAVQMDGVGTENITVSVPFGTDLKAVTTIKVSAKATVKPQSGTEITFVDGKPQKFVVTAEDNTVKEYTVTVNVRGEVGSGTKLKKVVKEDGLDGSTTTYAFTYNDADLVAGYTQTKGGKEKVFVLGYNEKNQIISKKNTTDKVEVTYAYNEKGQIISAEEKKEGKLEFSYVYEYNESGLLVKLTRKDKENDNYVQEFGYDGDNVVSHKIANDTYEATYDDKNNPFIGIYPNAYGKILAGNYKVISVNKNNFITKTGADAELVYEYNTDNFPVSYSYTVWGFATIKVTFEYF
ncbi:MAG: hypothetical protein KGV44_09250 [Flavobacteriaceae bacterium]|nr:hypothetical protein [Flavobacteriaceae bacterium]